MGWGPDWKSSFGRFYAECPDDVRYQIINTQLRRRSHRAADGIAAARYEADEVREASGDILRDLHPDIDGLLPGDVDDTDDNIYSNLPNPFQLNDSVKKWVDGALRLGVRYNLLPQPGDEIPSTFVWDVAKGHADPKLDDWLAAMAAYGLPTSDAPTNSSEPALQRLSAVYPLDGSFPLAPSDAARVDIQPPILIFLL